MSEMSATENLQKQLHASLAIPHAIQINMSDRFKALHARYCRTTAFIPNAAILARPLEMLLSVGEGNQWNGSLLPFMHEHYEIFLDFSGTYCTYDRTTAHVVRGPGNPGLTCSLECGTD